MRADAFLDAPLSADDFLASEPLPRGVEPSKTGAGRSSGRGGAEANDTSNALTNEDAPTGTRATEDRGFTPEPRRRRGGTIGDVKPYGAGDARINPPPEPVKPGGSVLDRPYTGERPPMSDAEMGGLETLSRKPAPPAPVGRMQASPPESTTGRALRQFDRKPLDQSLAAYPTEVAADAARGIAQVPGSLATSAYGALRAGADVVGADRFAEWAGKSAAAGQDYLKQLDNPNGDQMVTGALKSLGTTALGGAAGGSKTAISLMVGQTAADKYSQLRDAGVSIGEAMPDAVVHGYAEYLGERIGVPSLGRMVTSVAAKSGARPMAVLKEALKQQGEEQVTTALQSLNDKFGSGQLKPGLTWDQYLDDAVQTAAQTAIMTAAAGGAGAAARGAAKAYDFARGNGFHVDPPLTTDPAKTQRAKTLDIFENIAAKYGMNEAAKARAIEAVKDLPLDDVGPFLTRLSDAYAKRGLVKPVDKHAADTLSAGPIAPPEEVADRETQKPAGEKIAETATSADISPTDESAALEQRLAQKFGIDDGLSEPPQSAAPAQQEAGAEQPSPAAGTAALPTKAQDEDGTQGKREARKDGVTQEGAPGNQGGNGNVDAPPQGTSDAQPPGGANGVAPQQGDLPQEELRDEAQRGSRRLIGKVGRTPAAAVAVHLRPNKDGTLTPVHPSGEELLDFETGQPIVLPAGISDLGAIGAIRKAGAISNKSRFFKVSGEPESEAAPATPPTSAAEQPSKGAANGNQEEGQGQGRGLLNGTAARKKESAAAKARKLNPETDTLLQAIAKLGGIRREDMAREFGLKPEELKHKVRIGNLDNVPFRAKGGQSWDDALSALREAGYFAGVADEDARNAFEEAVYKELGGGQELTPQGQMKRAADMQAEATDQFDADQLEEAGFVDASDEAKAITQQLLEEAEALGIDSEALREDAARLSSYEESQDAYHARLQDITRQAIAQARSAAQQSDATATRGSAEGDGEVAGDAGEILTSQTAEDLKAKADREAAAEKADAAEQKRLAEKESADRLARDNKQRADQSVDDFQLGQSADQQLYGQKDIFSEPAPVPAPVPKQSRTVRVEKGDSEAVRQAKADALKALGDLGDILGRPGKAFMTPEQEQKLLPVLTRLMDAAFRLGYLKFKEAARFALEQIRAALGDSAADEITIDHLQGAYIGMAGRHRDAGAERAAAVAAVDSIDQLREDASDAPSTNPNLERNRADAAPAPPALETPVRAPTEGTGPGAGNAGNATREQGSRPANDPGVPPGGATAGRERGDQQLRGDDRPGGPAEFDAGTGVDQRGLDFGESGVPPETIPTGQVEKSADGGLSSLKKLNDQRAAEAIEVKPGNLANVRETLPYLLPEQQEDVHKAETRFGKPDGYGMLFTNGTGTGKTFTGLGNIKRFARRGKGNQLIMVPDAKIMADWVDSAKTLGLTITPLRDTKDAGKGIVITTYANAGDNMALVHRDWDLVTADEAHQLTQGKDGEETAALATLRAITRHPKHAYTRFTQLHADELAEVKRITDALDAASKQLNIHDMPEDRSRIQESMDRLIAKIKPLQAKLADNRKAIEADVAAKQGEARTRAQFLSATPFAYENTVNWADGYLFDFDEGFQQTYGYNAPSPRDFFFMQHFGWRKKNGKLTKPDEKVDRGLMQRQFNGWLKKRGALSGRMLEVKPDYDRKFVLVDSKVGNDIDRALDWISERAAEEREANNGLEPEDKNDGFMWLSDNINGALYGTDGHLVRRYLLEAIKAKEAVPIIKQHMALGRKVVVFHDFNKGGSKNPFSMEPYPLFEITPDTKPEDRQVQETSLRQRRNFNAALDAFRKEFPDLTDGNALRGLISPIQRFTQELPGVLLINGNEKPADVIARYKQLNDDALGPVVALVQSDKNKGWSGHDTTGKHPRVLINLGLPTQPTKTIQQEGRIYRVGQVSDAMFRYLNTGTTWERIAFAQTIARRASEAENLGAGEHARALLDAFLTGYEESDTYPPGHEGEGTGGKQRDRAMNTIITAYDRAKSFYWGTQKKNSRTKAQEGADYYATPEPVGLKMVEWLDLKGGEDGLEPSAGHGAIARWLPDNVSRTAVEPSMQLRSRLALVFDGKIVESQFEDLHVTNKYDGVAMNPPFGSAGRTAIDHVAKAATHLRDGGRIVALIPTGPAADKKFEKWFYDEAGRAVKPLFVHPSLGPVYAGDTVTTRASFAQHGKARGKSSATGSALLMVRADGSSYDSGVPIDVVTKIEPTGKRTETYKPAEGLYLIADIKLPGVTFERAGTGVMTRIVVLEKSADAPQQISRDYTDITDINTLFDRLEDLELKPRAKPIAEEAPSPAETAAAQKQQRQTEQAEKKAKAAAGAEKAADTGLAVVEYKTRKNKTIKGVIRTDLTKEQAMEIDPYTWRYEGGFFIRLEHMAKLLDKYPPPGSVAQEERAVYAVHEAEKNYDIPLDLFPESLSGLQTEPGRVGRPAPGPRASRATAGDVPTPTTLSVRQDPHLPGVYHFSTQLVEVTRRDLPVAKVTNWTEAASALSAMNRYAVEHFDALVTDKAGKPLAIIGSFKGALTQTSVYPSTLLAEALRIEGAARIWGVHNHPSGTEHLSRADEHLNSVVHKTFDASSVEWMGLAAIGGERFSAIEGDGAKGSIVSGAVISGAKKATIPVVERTITPGNAGMPAATSPAEVKRILTTGMTKREPGILFMNAQNQPTAWVPVNPLEMATLRKGGRFDKLINSASQAGAGSAVIANPGGVMNQKILNNVASALNLADVRTLDAIDTVTMESAAEKGVEPRTGFPILDLADENQPYPIALPTVLHEGPVPLADRAMVGRMEKVFRKEGGMPDLSLTALPRVPEPTQDAHEEVRKRFAAADIAQKLFGRRIVWFHSNRMFAHGMVVNEAPNVLFINENTTRPIMAVMGHELTHSMRLTNPDLYDKLEARIMALVKNPAAADREGLNLRRIAAGLPELNSDKLREEFVANVVGDNFSNPAFWRLLAADQPSTFQKVLQAVLDWLDGVLAKLKNERPYGTWAHLADIDGARNAVAEVMREFANANGSAMREKAAGGLPMFSLADRPLQPHGAVATVSLVNKHYNLYEAYRGSGPVLLLKDGRIKMDGMVLAPGDVVYAMPDGQFVKEIPQEERNRIAGDGQPAIKQMVQLSSEINRSVAKKPIIKNRPADEGFEDFFNSIMRGEDDGRQSWEAARYPKARPGWGSDLRRYERIDAISDTHAPDKIRDAYVDEVLSNRKFEVGGFLHVDDDAVQNGVSPEVRAALGAWRDRGGRYGKSVIDAIAKGGLQATNDPTNPDSDPNISLDLAGRKPIPGETKLRETQRIFQDQYNRFTVIRNWAEKNGVNMTPDSNVWRYEERMHGRIATRVQDFREKVMQPKIAAIQKAGFTMQQVADFLEAQHTAEANKKRRADDGVDPKDESVTAAGITDAEAAKYLAGADPKLKALANDLREITNDTKRILLRSGIVNTDITHAWEASYKHYVPLKGGDRPQGTGKGGSVAGKQHRRLGHGQRDEHIIENIWRDHERAITLEQKNIVGHSLLAFISEIADPAIGTIGQPEKRKVLKNSTNYEVTDGKGMRVAIFDTLAGANQFINKHSRPGLFGGPMDMPLTATKVRGDPSVAYMSSPMLADNEVNVYVKGHAIRVQLNDDLLARAFTKGGVDQLNRLLSMNREINTYLSKAYTGYNPAFFFKNIIRDFGTGLINITGQFGAGVTAKAVANYPKAFGTLMWHSVTGKATKDIQQYRDAGGSVGAAYLSDLERIGKDMQEAYNEYRGVIETTQTEGAVAGARTASKKFLGHLMAWMEHLNAAGESAMRLAVFEAVRDTKGYSVNDAASASKNSTVNFNRRGEMGSMLGSMYLFFNPSVQGTAAIMDSLANGKHKWQARALTAALAGTVYALAKMQFGGGDDDDDAWRKIPDSVKNRNLVFRAPWLEKGYFTLPIPYGYGFMATLGNAAYDLQRGREKSKVAVSLASSLFENFSPVGNPVGDKLEARGLGELVPGAVGGELMRDAVRVMTNRSGLGGDIVPDSPFDRENPDHRRMYRGTKGRLYDTVATGLATATGGTKALEGGIDVSPETLKFWTGVLTGGTGTFIADTANVASLAVQSAMESDPKARAALAPEVREIPIVRDFVRKETVQDSRRVFWEAVKEVEAAQKDLARVKKDVDREGYEKLGRDKGALLSKEIQKTTTEATKLIKAKRDMVDQLRLDDTLSRAAKRIATAEIEEAETSIYDRYVRIYTDRNTAARESRP